MRETHAVRVRITLTDNRPFPRDLFIEVDDAETNDPVSVFSSLKSAHAWLTGQGYKYINGTNGVWAK
jgi:hypothetical protein